MSAAMTKADLTRENERMRWALEQIESVANAVKWSGNRDPKEYPEYAVAYVKASAFFGLRGYHACDDPPAAGAQA